MDEKNYERVCLYLLRMADYMSDPDDLLVRLSFSLFRHLHQRKQTAYVYTVYAYAKRSGSRLLADLCTSLSLLFFVLC